MRIVSRSAPAVLGCSLFLLAAASPAEDVGVGVAGRAVYRISAGDTIAIFVAERPDLTSQVRVPLEGKVIIPDLGAVAAAGWGVEDLSREIARRLEDEAHFVKPRVAVSVVAYGSRMAYVYGAVQSSRAVDLPPERPLTLAQAAAACGGFRDDADREHVRITRRPEGKPPRVFEVDAQKIAEGASPELDPVLEPGDTVYVPQREPVYVLGQVQKPGAHPVPYGYPFTVSKAVALSGGFGKYARKTRVRVTRRTGADATPEMFTIDLAAVFEGQLDKDMGLRPGDTVYVPERVF